MIIDAVKTLQSVIVLSRETKVIITNRNTIKQVRDELEDAIQAVKAIERANQEMCSHNIVVAYPDPREPGFDCLDCGAKR